MKLNDALRFPHPVLSPGTGDYLSGTIDTKLSVREDAEAGRLQVSGNFDVTHRGIRSLIESGDVQSRFLVSCLDTYYVSQHPIGLGEFTLDVPSGKLRGAVSFRVVLVVKV